MNKLGIILDSTVDQLKCESLFKDAVNVSLSFIKEDTQKNVLKEQQLNLNNSINPRSFISQAQNLYENGCEHILVITSSKILTQSYENALLAKDIFGPFILDVIDSNTFGPGILYLLTCIKLWVDKKYSYQKIKDLLKLQIEKGVTLVVTSKATGEKKQTIIQKLLSPWVQSNLSSSVKNYHVEQVIYNQKMTTKTLYKHILGYKGFHPYVYIFVYSGLVTNKAKVFLHELYTQDKDLNIQMYGEISKELSTYFGDDVFGIYLGYYEEAPQ